MSNAEILSQTNTEIGAVKRPARRVLVKVLTYVDFDSAEPESDFTIDISNPERQEWLYQKHLFWAFTNHRFVELYNVADEPT